MVTKRPHPTHWTATILKAAATALLIRGGPRRVVVAGSSMEPAFSPGDRLLVVPMAGIRPGHVVALRDPRDPARVLVKRVRAVGPEGIDVRGDNAGASTDSRHFGTVPAAALLGRALYRYHPPDRSGWFSD